MLPHLRRWQAVAAVWVCVSVPVIASPPIEDIRQLLIAHLPQAPDAAALHALSGADFNAALRAIDPHARYFPAQDLRPPALGQATGIGAVLVMRDNAIELIPYQGSPLDRAGLPERVILYAIDGQTVAHERDEQRIANRLRGTPGSPVTLWVVSLDWQQSWTVELHREPYKALDVEVIRLGERAVLRIHQFVAGLTRSALRASIDFLERDTEPVIIDLRDALGGDLYEALDTAALFLPKGTPLGVLHRYGGQSDPFQAPFDNPLSVPLIILVGPDTASAAEVFAGILQQHGRAQLMGRPTFGKCSTQTEIRLSNGGVLRLTNGEVELPNATACPLQGLRPDILVPEADIHTLETLLPYVPAG